MHDSDIVPEMTIIILGTTVNLVRGRVAKWIHKPSLKKFHNNMKKRLLKGVSFEAFHRGQRAIQYGTSL